MTPNVYAAPAASPDANSSSPVACPRCNAAAVPRELVQQCAGCGRSFTLSAGPAMDSSVLPPHWQLAGPNINLKWSVVVTYRYAALDPGGVTYGTLDPVVGVAPIEQRGIPFGDVLTLTVWRDTGWVEPIIGILVPIPIAAFFVYTTVLAAIKGSGGGVIILALLAIAFGLAGAFMVYRGVKIGKRFARIAGRWTTFTVPFGQNTKFHEQLFRRCGLTPPPIP